MEVHFADVIAEVREFCYKGTYDGYLEGSYASCSQHILEELMNKGKGSKGEIVIPSYRDAANTELKDCHYSIYARTDSEHIIFVDWFGDEPDEKKPIAEVIEEVTRNINFEKNCRFIDWDEF